MSYVDGFVVPVPKRKLEDYKKLSQQAAKLWKEHGALEYVEAVGDDVPMGKVTSFPQAVKLEPDEVVVFSWIVYKSKEDRDRINKEVMEDPMMKADPSTWPFDGKRMFMGGFAPIVGL
ncbi:MAG TPA: DUF1428 domain-containing protein [Kofleriaceae bacterium]|jgi:uncharacterized protein YbaA (DUF1428 family)|nr:DUF1428 domain-containing protein [Kofleriaceae bacterium]